MIIKVSAFTLNAFRGIQAHYKDCDKLRNRLRLRSFGITQNILLEEMSLEICYKNILTKLKEKMQEDKFKAILSKDQKKDFLKEVHSFMSKKKVDQDEYEVTFNNDTE